MKRTGRRVRCARRKKKRTGQTTGEGIRVNLIEDKVSHTLRQWSVRCARGGEEFALMSSESITRYEESVLGEYKLGAVVKRSPAGTVYETEFCGYDGERRPAVIKVCELDAYAAMTAVRRYRSAMRLEHPHLLCLYAAGTSRTDGVTKAWVVMERADESLAGVLGERALSEDEVGEMLRPAVAALAHLHKNGYAHGAIRPSNVLAAGDQLKLSSDNAVLVSGDGVPAVDVLAEDIRAADIQALGALIAESLTERGPHGVIRHPTGRFAEIVRHCSEPDPAKRWTAEQIAARLDEKAAEPPPETIVRAPQPELSRRSPESHRAPTWILAALAAVVLAVLLTAVLRKNSNNTPAPVATSPAVPAESKAVPAAAPPPPAIQPVPAKAKPFPEPPLSNGRKADGWFVIVGAYGSRDAAEKRMNSLVKRWPGFHLKVSERSSERAPWLVTLGENLSEDEAESVRARAVHAGLPHDAYIKRIK